MRRSSSCEGFPHFRDSLGIEAGFRQFVIRSGSDVRQTAILFEQAGPCDLADAAYLIQLRGHQSFAAQLAMEGDRKSMGFVANTLDEMGGRRVRAKHNRDFFDRAGKSRSSFSPRALANPIIGQVSMADLFQPFHGGSKLA